MPQQPIKSKVNSLASAPTPQNTPASVTNSYLKSNPLASKLPNTIDEDDENELRSKLASNPAFLSMIEGKLGSLVGAKSGYIDNLPKQVKNRIYSLKAVQSELQEVEDQFQKELFELERKYLTKYSPIHEKRKQIINGEKEPSEADVTKGKEIERELGAEEDENEEDEDEEEEKEDKEEKDEDDVKGIPDFWLTALENLSQVANIITERDQEVLSHLTNIRLEYLEKPGFQLVFEFSENPYFRNSSLTKSYYYQEELGYSGDFIYDHAEGSTIEWSSTKRNVTINIERRKQRNKSTQQTRTIEKATPIDSFFNFFDPPRADEQEEREEDEEFDDAAEELEQRLAFDYQLGEEIKDKLIPRAIDWFTGSAIEYEGDEFDDEDFDEEEGDEDDEDEDEDDEEEDDNEEGGEKKPAECKQT